MPFEIVRNDITKMQTDAIVNAANPALTPGGGVCGAIFEAAGFEKLERACRKIGRCEVGSAVITPGFDLPAKYVIHAAGPIWQGGDKNEPELLKSCYRSALELARRHRLRSIAFPLISAGIFGYPKAEALSVAVSAISEFLLEHDMTVYLVVYERGAVVLSEKLLGSIRSYIDEHYVKAHTSPRPRSDRQAFYQFMNHTGALPDLAEHIVRPAAAPQS
ncbi:MAG: macro domain-containing protein, partial [Oscillospiraceae bacterium]|nr:macro domain-containing protein [Oscillospiraceae bacterium]